MTETARLKAIVIAVSVVAVAVWTGIATAAEFSLGKVDLQELYRKSRTMQLAYQSIRELQAESGVKLAKFQHEMKEMESKLKQGKDSLSPDARSELLAKLKAKREEMKAEREALQVKVDFKKKSIENSLGPQVKKAIATVAKEAGLKAVLPVGVFAYDAGVVDITDKVVQVFDATAAAPKPDTERPSGTEGKK